MIAGLPIARLARRAAPLLALAGALLAPGAGAGEPDARMLLERMRSAASVGNYQGTIVFSASGSISSSRIWHYCVGDQTYERLEAQDGRLQRVFRHNDEVRTFWPQARVAVVERREPLAGWSTKPQAIEERALESYALREEGEARVAGRAARVLVLEPRDALRYAQRLWVDRASGLMLRADVLAPGQGVLETAAFSEIEIDVRPDPQRVLQGMRSAEQPTATRGDGAERREGGDTWQVLRPAQRRTQLEAEGWTLKAQVPGFRLASCALRGIAYGSSELPVLQAVFSDGLTHVSLFVEPYRAERHRGAVQARLGATSTVTRRLDEHWVTVVGDVPVATLERFAAALERRR